MNANNEFRDKLLSQEGFSGQCDDYKNAIRKALDKKLGLVNRILYGLICLAGLVSMIYFFNITFLQGMPDSVIAPAIKLICFIALVVIGILTIFTGWSALTGKSRGHFHPPLVFGGSFLILLFYVVAMSYFLWICPLALEGPTHPHMVVGFHIMIIFFFAMTLIGLLLLLRAATEARFQSQRKLLEIEYKLCMMMEQLEKLQRK